MYKLFETLNERGLELSQADLEKNITLEFAEKYSKESLEMAKNDWDDILDFIDNQREKGPKLNTAQLIQYSFSARREVVKAGGLFDKYEETLQTKIDPTD